MPRCGRRKPTRPTADQACGARGTAASFGSERGATSRGRRLTGDAAATPFRHDALLYEGDEQFLDGALPFIREGLERDEHVLVVLDDAKAGLVLSELGSDADEVQFCRHARGRSQPRAPDPVVAPVHRCPQRVGERGPGTRRTRVGGSQRRGAGRVRAARGAAQLRVRRCRRALDALPVRARRARRRRDRTCALQSHGDRRVRYAPPQRRLPRRRCRGRAV